MRSCFEQMIITDIYYQDKQFMPTMPNLCCTCTVRHTPSGFTFCTEFRTSAINLQIRNLEEVFRRVAISVSAPWCRFDTSVLLLWEAVLELMQLLSPLLIFHRFVLAFECCGPLWNKLFFLPKEISESPCDPSSSIFRTSGMHKSTLPLNHLLKTGVIFEFKTYLIKAKSNMLKVDA